MRACRLPRVSADGHPHIVPVRDSKQPEGPHVVFHARAWADFVGSLRDRG
ncbi:DUF397 domain-containing protein [Streptomyces sp. NPDC054883]